MDSNKENTKATDLVPQRTKQADEKFCNDCGGGDQDQSRTLPSMRGKTNTTWAEK